MRFLFVAAADEKAVDAFRECARSDMLDRVRLGTVDALAMGGQSTRGEAARLARIARQREQVETEMVRLALWSEREG